MKLVALHETSRLADKTPAPRVSGELSRQISDLNIRNAEALNRWAEQVGSQISRFAKRLKFNVNVELVKLDDWRQGGAAFVRVFYQTGDLSRTNEIAVRIMDSNNVKVAFPPELAATVGLKGTEQVFRSHKARDSAVKLVMALLEENDDFGPE